jgi:DNA-binding response OmpR family regulator
MKKILIVDDDNSMRGMLRMRLKDTYEVIETGEPEQALGLALEQKPDAILLDLMMPKFSGLELCQNFQSFSQTSGVPIFVITGHAGADRKQQCREVGASGVFEKPLDFTQLKATLKQTLEARPQRQANAGLHIRMPIKLHGTNATGAPFTESTTTESVSGEGFFCISTHELQEGSLLEVFLASQSDRFAGRARVQTVEPQGSSGRKYQIAFEGTPENWIVTR